MTRAALVLVLVVAFGASACTDTVQRVESVERYRRAELGRPLRSEWAPVLVAWSSAGGIVAEARISTLCPSRELVGFAHVRVTEVTPSDVRWLVAAPLVVIGVTAAVARVGGAGLPAGLVIGGAIAATLPEAGRRTKRERIGREIVARPAGLVRCAERALPASTVTLRTLDGTREARTDARGRAFFPELSPARVRHVYVDDVVAPVVWIGREMPASRPPR